MKIFGEIILGVATLLAGSTLAAERFYVDRDFQGEQSSGLSWLSAFSSVEDALDAATDGGEIWIKAGVYKPTGKTREATFRLNPSTELYGGFRGNETTREQRNPRANRTVLSGDIGRIGSFADNCHHVVTAAAKSRIDGFIVSSGHADGTDAQGGGVLIDSKAENFTIANCTFEKNHATTGGAMYIAATGTTLSNCTFFSNSANLGGAIHIADGAKVRATDCKFTSNFARKSGGALAIQSSSTLWMARSWFLSNRTEGTGGAIASSINKTGKIKLALEKCEFIKNLATQDGGALFNHGSFIPKLTQCRFIENISVQGAGVMANRNGATVALLEATFVRNQSANGVAEIDSDATSKTVTDASALARAEKAKPVLKPIKKRQLANVDLLDDSGERTKLRRIISKSDYCVLATGDLTDPQFINSYRIIEASARDYSKKGVGFFYIYCYLIHPENNRYVQPVTLEERFLHIVEAKRLFRTRVPWLCDGMDNEAAKALDRETNNLFIFNQHGREEYAGNIADADGFRDALTRLVGRIESPTRPQIFTPPDIAPVMTPEARVVKRVEIDPSKTQFKTLRTTPVKSRAPLYVKVRIEASKELLETGSGRMYLGFHLDPLYKVKWNNLGAPLDYAIKPPRKMAIAPSVNQAKKIEGIPADSEPREFLLQVWNWDPANPVALTVNYSILSPRSKRTRDISQRHILHLEHDPFGGTVIGRQIPVPD